MRRTRRTGMGAAHCGRPRRIAATVSALAVAASLTLIATPTSSASPPPPRRPVPVIKRSVSFTATETSVTRVRFGRTIKWDEIAHVHLKGQGRMYGLLLRKVGNYAQEANRPFVKWLSSAMCTKRGCRTDPKEHPGVDMAVHSGDFSELSGLWDVYVIADGAPVTAEIDIEGSKRRDKIRVTRRVKSDFRNLPTHVHETATNTVYSAGDFSKLESPDFGQVGIVTKNGPYAGSTGGFCGYRTEEDATPVEAAFLPGCPKYMTGIYALPFMTDVFPSERRNPFRSGAFVDGEQAIGGWFATGAVVQEFAIVGLWIDFPEVTRDF